MAPSDREPHNLPTASAEASATRQVPILVNFTLGDEHLQRIEAADPCVRLMRAYTEADPDARARGEEGNALEGEALMEMVREAEVIFGFRFPLEWLDIAPHLKWVQLASAGSDHMQRLGLFDKRPDLLLTTASGVHEIPISEHIVAMLLHFARGFHRAVRNQAEGKWERYRAEEAAGKVACLVGYGSIARRTATLLKTLGMKVIAVRASIAEQQPGFEAVERFYPPEELNAVLSQSDYVIIAAPRTPRTEGMLGRDQFRAMKPTAVLINISRGALVDEPALIEALQSGTIGGAALDVFSQEPLPETSPLWAMPNVLITPHVSGSNPHYDHRVTDLFIDNLKRYLAGEPLRNRVDMVRGY
jgi:phosphoglycerate dehydrogenase-like enzyme